MWNSGRIGNHLCLPASVVGAPPPPRDRCRGAASCAREAGEAVPRFRQNRQPILRFRQNRQPLSANFHIPAESAMPLPCTMPLRALRTLRGEISSFGRIGNPYPPIFNFRQNRQPIVAFRQNRQPPSRQKSPPIFTFRQNRQPSRL